MAALEQNLKHGHESIEPTFIPFDTTSTIERKVFLAQRIICGWKNTDPVIDEMYMQHDQGGRILYWIGIPVSSPAVSDQLENAGLRDVSKGILKISRHGTKVIGLEDSVHLDDTDLIERSITDEDVIYLPLIRQRTRLSQDTTSAGDDSDDKSQLFVPVGHISIDMADFEEPRTKLLGNYDGQIVSITTLFIVPCFRRYGLANKSMYLAERMIRSGDVLSAQSVSKPQQQEGARGEDSQVSHNAVRALQKCETIALSTLSERHFKTPGPDGTGVWERMGTPGIGVTRTGLTTKYHGNWYAGLGYRKVHDMQKFQEREADGNGYKTFHLWAEIWHKNLA